MVSNFLKAYIRTLWRNKIYSIINIIGLSIATACAMLIVLYVNDEASYDKFHANGENIYRIVNRRLNPDGSQASTGGNSGYLQGPVFTENVPGIETFVRMKSYEQDIRSGGQIFRTQVHYTDPDFFKVFTFPLISGDEGIVLKTPNSIVVSESMAQNLFGTTDVLGKTIEVKKNGAFQLYDVTGVAKDAPDNSSIRFNFVAQMIPSSEDLSWGSYFLNTFVVISPDADVVSLESKVQTVYEKVAKDELIEMSEKYGATTKVIHLLQPFTQIHLSEQYRADNGMTGRSSATYSYILSAIAGFILLIACINFINLTVSRSMRRAREIGIRKVVGGSKVQLSMQFFTESLLVCVAAFVIAIGIVQTALPSFNILSNKVLYISYLFEVDVIAMIAGLFILTALLTGVYPSLILSAFNPVKALKNKLTLGGDGYLQKLLVVFQFALSTFLVIGTITIVLQFNFLTHQPLGYDDHNVLIIPKTGLKHSEARVLKNELLKSPDIIDVSMKSSGREGTTARLANAKEVGFDYETIDPSYLSLYKIPLIQGRDFSPEFPTDSNHSVIVNQAFVKQAGWTDPIGEELDFWHRNEKYKVIGVVNDYHFLSLDRESGPLVLTMRTGKDYGMGLVRVNPGRTHEALAFIESTFKKLFPESLYEYKFKEAENYLSYANEERWKKIMMVGAGMTIFLSCIGLFGLTVMTAERRTKEMGIRKILGASVANAVAILTSGFVKLVMISLIIALPAAWVAVDTWLLNYPYHISLNWTIFATGAMLMLLISLVTVSFQALKTALANPVDSLRIE